MKSIKISFLLAAPLLYGCASSKPVPYQAKWQDHSLFYQSSPTDQVDMKSRLKFGVQNNDEMLFATISTREPEIISRIITNGVKLSVYPPGEKKKGMKVLFPVVLKEDRRAIRRMDQVEMLGPSMQLLLETFNKEAIVDRGSGERFVNLVDADNDLYCRINMTVDGELTINYILPLNYITPIRQDVVTFNLSIADNSRSGFSPGISVGMGSYGGIGMGGMGVGVGTGGRNAYRSQPIDLKLDVNLAKAGS